MFARVLRRGSIINKTRAYEQERKESQGGRISASGYIQATFSYTFVASSLVAAVRAMAAYRAIRGQELTVEICRDGLNAPWGFRLYGGTDFDSPLIVQRVSLQVLS